MMKALFLLLCMLFVFACQQKPTRVLEESADIFDRQVVLLDTRNPLDFASFHVEGSQSLWWEDFIILQNPASQRKKRVLDSDLNQIVERLAKKGVSQSKKVYLIGSTKNSIENKKWKWLLEFLEITDIQFHDISEIRKIKNGRFSTASSERPWLLKTSEEFQKEFILKKAPQCFVKWSDKNCS